MKTATYFGKFHEAAPTAVKARGFLHEFLLRQQSGLTGNHTEQGYPYDSEMWAGRVEDVHLSEGWHKGRKIPVVPTMAWWPYEQAGYLLDGMLRLGILLGDEAMVEKFEKNLSNLLAHPDARGRLGQHYNESGSEWPMAVFFKAVIARLGAKPDAAIEAAFHRHFASLTPAELGIELRHITNLEGILKLYEWTKDEALKELAVAGYEFLNEYIPKIDDPYEELWFDKLASEKRIVMHGVSVSESLKLPVLLYLHTGEQRWLDGAVAGLDAIMRDHGLEVGLPSSNEYLSGRDPLQGYETCVISDFAWSVGYFLMATGDGRYADWLEKIAFNALPGSVTPDFTRLQYLSSPNQVLATPFSNQSHSMRGENAWRQYKANHIPECCGGNVHRAMPNYVLRMFLLDGLGAPCAATYGPAEFSASFGGTAYKISEETEYPFGETIRFRFHLEKNLEMPFSFRIPAWCSAPRIALNGENLPLPPREKGFAALRRVWRDGDVLELTLPMRIELAADRQYRTLVRGPLVYAYPVPNVRTQEGKGRFAPLNLEPAGPWNFALDLTPEEAARLEVVKLPVAYPYDAPPLSIRVPVRRVTHYDELELGRYTPDVPLLYRVAPQLEFIDLVPYGCTSTRISAFPDTVERKALPVVNVTAAGPYPYDWRNPITEQRFEPEILSDEAFNRKYASSPVQGNPNGYYDLIRHFKASKDVLGYMQFRIYAETAGPAVLALGVSDAAQAYLNGEAILSLDPVQEAELCAPHWFDIVLREGYNYLRLKVGDMRRPGQYRDDWGANVTVFR